MFFFLVVRHASTCQDAFADFPVSFCFWSRDLLLHSQHPFHGSVVLVLVEVFIFIFFRSTATKTTAHHSSHVVLFWSSFKKNRSYFWEKGINPKQKNPLRKKPNPHIFRQNVLNPHNFATPILWEGVEDLRYTSECKITITTGTNMLH